MSQFLNQIISLYEQLNTGISISEALTYVFDTFRKYIPFDRIGITLLESDGSIYAYEVRTNHSPVLDEGYSEKLCKTSLNTIVKMKKHRIINDYKEYLKLHPKSAPTKLMVSEGIMSSLACPLVVNSICIGVLLFSCRRKNRYNESHAAMAKIISSNMAIILERNLLVDDLILSSVTGLAKLVEAKDSDTGFHLERMQSYSKIIAQALASKEKYANIIDKHFIENIFKFSPLHDIGKAGIADGILLKPAKYTPEEFEVMKKHTVIGAEILRKSSSNLLRKGKHFFDFAIQIAEGHHEKYNGKGYPYGLSGDSIPLPARIVAIADVFDAVTSKRVYKNAYDIETTLQIIDKESGKSFDPDVVEALNHNIEQIVQVYKKYHEQIDLEIR
ncbi:MULTISPECIES: HD domain-containing phosphohydrolase [Oscillospiraceae]|jgi:HD-GYP domain-containing protein (c-di-GMP phosphodiesterase class II)|uniref:Putative phytochrome sensor protein n=1 Tax=Pseudobacteroides cellulosolvens ATCC 35603 = DSM 2933 TaxID=398512 RepID=A0A0L6JTR3_9FIRM|nr:MULTISPECIES: HD domain-containing phosphohydrolase [Oscillospiraceae]KNY29080.1 putative phytochrome sensor protein [Pseudobacteroides cellulosolvens ATCC 35603 = DSM 2933]MCX7746564.1 HD domain-containing protein [Clostridia bacterium]